MWRKIERFQILIILVENFMQNYPSKIYLPQESIFKSKLLYSLHFSLYLKIFQEYYYLLKSGIE